MYTSFDMNFAPNPQVVSVVRRFVMSLYERLLERSELSSALALATHELVENVVKYNTDDTAYLRVSVRRGADAVSPLLMTICTRNRASPADITLARQVIERVRQTDDPARLYQEMILASITADEGSGLGLVRIRAETEMTVDVRIDGDQIEFVAESERDLGGRP